MIRPLHSPALPALRPLAGAALLTLSLTTFATPSHAAGNAGARSTPSRQHVAVAQLVSTTIILGRQGGNIRPFTITIDAGGSVQVSGGVQSHGVTNISKVAVRGLLKLARAEGFFHLRPHLVSPQVLPDVAALYITIVTPSGRTTVTERGAHNAHFDQLFAVLLAAAGAGF
ncbi:MAG: hypothetical protein M3Z66_16110 [Chloroflexota bacterium]|nr:hypothetical protein [Chloroflexota bacterium]